MISKPLMTNEIENYRLSIAPMMDCTDRHFRVLMRQITKKSLLHRNDCGPSPSLQQKQEKIIRF